MTFIRLSPDARLRLMEVKDPQDRAKLLQAAATAVEASGVHTESISAADIERAIGASPIGGHLPGKPWVAACAHEWVAPRWDWYIEDPSESEPRAMCRRHCSRCSVTYLYIGMDPSLYPLDFSTAKHAEVLP